MKRLVNLGMTLVVALVIIGCQKEDISLSQGWEKDSPAVDYSVNTVPGTVFEPAPAPPTRPGYEPGSIFVPAPGSGGETTGDTPTSGGSNVPDGGIYDNVDPPIWGGDINEIMSNLPSTSHYRTAVITWHTEAPTDPKWKMYTPDGSAVTKDRAIPVSLCPYEDCNTAIQEAVAALQVQANIYCQDMYSCVACCIGNSVVYACIVAYHQCGIIPQDDPQDF